MGWKALVLATGVVSLAACSDGGPNGTSQVAVAVAAQVGTPAGAGAFLSATQTDSSGNTLVLDSVSLVVRKIKLERAACGGSDDSMEVETGAMLSDSGDHEMDDDDCPVLRAGPVLVALPLGDSTAEHQFTATVDTGTYSSAMFQIHVPVGENDTAFTLAHPEMAGASIRVVGTFNGTPFVYTAAITDVQRVRFSPPLVVGSDPVSFTLFVDLSGWFRGEGGTLIDPGTATAGTLTAAMVRLNILRSFHCFRDEDHDGHED